MQEQSANWFLSKEKVIFLTPVIVLQADVYDVVELYDVYFNQQQ